MKNCLEIKLNGLNFIISISFPGQQNFIINTSDSFKQKQHNQQHRNSADKWNSNASTSKLSSAKARGESDSESLYHRGIFHDLLDPLVYDQLY